MNTTESKELAERLTGKEVIEEAIEGLIIYPEELQDEIRNILVEDQEYTAYINPIEGEQIVVHVILKDQVIVSYLMNEDGEIKEVFNGTGTVE